MKSNKIHLLIILTLIFAIVGATMAAYEWVSGSGNETNVLLTINKNFSCAADGGGDITSDDVMLMPTTCTDDEYEEYRKDHPEAKARVIRKEITVTNAMKIDGLTIHTDLWLNVDYLESALSRSRNLKYALTTSANSCTDGVIYTGSFYGLKDGDKVKLLGQKYTTEEPQKYYLYIWMDKAETNPDILDHYFEFSLGGECSDITSADLSYNVNTVDGVNTFGVGSGYYELDSYTCKNGSTISYDPITKKITSNGIDKCNLNLKTKETTLYDVVKIGDYIAYSGDSNNGCVGNRCNGWNANQTATDLYEKYGYCSNTNYKFTSYGWRVLYKENNSVYIVSAGSPECIKATASNSKTTLNNIHAASAKYFNELYVSEGISSRENIHNLTNTDFYKFSTQYYGAGRYLYSYNDQTGGGYGSPYCYSKKSTTYCGYNNDLIDNGGYYFFGNSLSSVYTLYWNVQGRYVSVLSGADTIGIRPVIKLDSSIKAIGGNGTQEKPYMISERAGI